MSAGVIPNFTIRSSNNGPVLLTVASAWMYFSTRSTRCHHLTFAVPPSASYCFIVASTSDFSVSALSICRAYRSIS